MKTIVSHLLAVLFSLLLTQPAFSGCPPTPTSYCRDLPPGLSLFAVHMDAGFNTATLPSTSLPPGPGDGLLVYRFNPVTKSYDVYIYDQEAGGWLPSAPVLNHGEGVFIDNVNSSATTLSWNSSGPNTVFPSPLQNGIFLLGSQRVGTTIFKGTFETITGRSPRNYQHATLYRYNPAAAIGLSGLPFDVFHYAKGHWWPYAPVLEVGEGAFLKLGPFATPPIPGACGNSVSGITTNEATVGQIVGGTVPVYVTGENFAGTETVQLYQPPGTPVAFRRITGTVIASDPYLLQVTFNTTGKSPGWYDLRVKKAGCTTWTVVKRAFYLKPAGAKLNVKVVGPNITSPSVTPTYFLSVDNTGSAGINGGARVGIQSWASWTSILPTTAGFTAGLPYLTTSSSQYFPIGPSAFSFQLKASLPMVGLTRFLTNEIFSPASDIQFFQFPIKVLASIDPNAKYGPQGSGPAHHVTGLDPFDYMVTFQNKPNAPLPAQYVEIIDQLDTTRLDLTTFQLGPISFGPKVVVPPPGLQTWTTDLAYDVDGVPSTLDDNILVRVTGKLDAVTTSATYGQVKWTFESLESTFPFLPISDPLVGFLPADIADGVGEGSVTFKVSPFPYLPSGDIIQNDAKITFDANYPITTDPWINTIDNEDPDSSVQPLAPVQNSAAFAVNWAGSDADSGIATYDVYVSDNNGPFTVWQSATTATTANYLGQANHTYAFYSVATDNVGLVEAEPEEPDTITTVQSGSPTLHIEVSDSNVVLTWDDPGFHLESTTDLGSSGVWSVVTGTSPVTVARTGPARFFRLVNP